MSLLLLGAGETIAPATFLQLTASSKSDHIFYRLVHSFKQILHSLRTRPVDLKPQHSAESPQELVKNKVWGAIPTVSVSVGQGRGLKMCISDRLLRLLVMGALLSAPCTSRVPTLRFRRSTL